jgi:ribosomal protein L11 methyltransferase
MHWLEILIELPAGVSPETAYAVIYANGSTGCAEEGDTLRAYFEPDADMDAVTRGLEAVGARVASTACIEDKDWMAGWKETIGPYRAAGFLICPPWKTDECVPAPGEAKIIVDPGAAFGEGGHPTTASVLGLMRKWTDGRGDLSNCAMLDVGTGTGILSVAGGALGFGNIRAVDIEQKAVDTAKANFSHNGLGDNIEVTKGGIDTVTGSYDLVVANVFLEPLLVIIPKAVSMLKPGGGLITSGVLTDQFADIEACALEAGLSLSERVNPDGWVSGLFVRRV